MSRTGPLVTALADGVKQDLAEVAADLEAVRAKIDALGEAAIALNGLRDDTAGWSNHLGAILEQVRKEETEIPAKLLGNPIPQIVQTIDSELVGRVKRAKEVA